MRLAGFRFVRSDAKRPCGLPYSQFLVFQIDSDRCSSTDEMMFPIDLDGRYSNGETMLRLIWMGATATVKR